ncbi:MAG TPA: hypothetical protein VJN43_03820 [Bryobacteraceae bacterium]|nr:hypothetical protein [Bryobacteraceae bacterium]
MPENDGPPALPPAIQALLQAFLLAEKEEASEIGVHHLLAALDHPEFESEAALPPAGPFTPVPRQDKPLSSDACAAIEAACARVPCELEQLSTERLRAALVAARADPSAG